MEENDLPNLISLSVFEFVLIMACSIIAISLFVFITGIILGLIGGVKYTKKKLKNNVPKNDTCTSEEDIMKHSTNAIYEEVELKENVSINLSQNIAYGHIQSNLNI